MTAMVGTAPRVTVRNKRAGRVRHLLLGFCLWLAACVGVPTEQLRSYVDGFEEAIDGGALIYAALVPALQAAGTADSQDTAFRLSLGSPVYQRGHCAGDLALYDALLVRCQALAAVSQANQAMLLLAQGRTAAAVLPQLQSFYQSASTLASLVPVPAVTAVFATAGALFPAVKTIAEQALQIADAARLKAFLKESEPTLRQLLDELGADVARIYQLQYRYYETLLDASQTDIDRAVVRLKRGLASHAAPASSTLLAERRALDARFDRIFVGPEPGFGAERLSAIQPDPAARTAFDAELLTSSTATLDVIEQNVQRFNARVAEWGRFRQALATYDEMLGQVRLSFDQLTSASANPFSSGGAMPQLLATAFTIRDQVREIRAQLADRPRN